MNPLLPYLHVSTAYVARTNQEHGARLLAALRSPDQALALTRLWREVRETDPAISAVIDHLEHSLDPEFNDPTRVVGITVNILTPPPSPPPGHLWTREGTGQPWHTFPARDIPRGYKDAAQVYLAMVYRHEDVLHVVGCDRTFNDYAAAATMSAVIRIAARAGLTTAMRHARAFLDRGDPGADVALDFIEGLAGAVEGL